jgi:SAM-dependent methyltransferase
VQAARRGALVHAVDVSPAMLALARRRATEAGTPNITFHQAGFLSYRHVGPPADAVVSVFALHHLPDFWKQVALLNVARILRPGGRFFLRDVVFSFPATDYAAGIETWIANVAREDGSGWPRAAFETHVREEHSTFGWVMEGLLTRAGFVLEAVDYDGVAYADYLCRRAD